MKFTISLFMLLLLACASSSSVPLPSPYTNWQVLHCITKEQRSELIDRIIDLEEQLIACQNSAACQ